MADLQPYVCPYGCCSSTFCTYATLSGWREHVRDVHHGRHVWVCFACTVSTGTPADFMTHMETQHAGTYLIEQLPDMLDMCMQQIQAVGYTSCPLCRQDAEAGGDLESHLAVHFEDFALSALPSTDYEESDDDGSLNYELEETELASSLGNLHPTGPLPHTLLPISVPIALDLFPEDSIIQATSSSGIGSKKTYLQRIFRKPSPQDLQILQNETYLLARLRHPHTVQIAKAFLEHDGSYHQILYPAVEMSLLEYLHRTAAEVNSSSAAASFQTLRSSNVTSQLYRWFGCLSGALSFMHTRNITHNNVGLMDLFVKGKQIYYSNLSQRNAEAPLEFRKSLDIKLLGHVFLDMWSLCLKQGVAQHDKMDKLSHLFHLVEISQGSDQDGCTGDWASDTSALPSEWCFAMLQYDLKQQIDAKALHSTIYTAHCEETDRLGKNYGYMGRCAEDMTPVRGPLHLIARWPDKDEIGTKNMTWEEANRLCGYRYNKRSPIVELAD